MRIVTLTAVLATTMLAVATSATAAAPQRFVNDFQFSDTIDCSEFNPAWTFHDDFTDFFHDRGQVWFDAGGNPLRAIEHFEHHSNDVNSVTGFTLHEHNHFTITTDFVKGTMTLSGAINIMQRPGVGEVIHTSGHKVIDLETGEPIAIHGPDDGGDADFCAAVAP